METRTSQPQTKIKRGARVWLVYIQLSFFGYVLNVAGPAVTYLRDEFSLSFTESGLHTSALALGMVVMGLFGHFILKKLPEWKALGLGGIGLGVGGMIFVLGSQPFVTLAGLFLMGAIGSLIVSTNPAILADEMGQNGKVGVSEANTLTSIFSTLAPIAVGFFGAMAVTWRPAVYIVTSMAFLVGLWVLISPQFPWENRFAGAETTIGSSKLPGKYWFFWSALVVSISIEFCMIYWSSDYLQAHLAMPKDSATQWVSLFLVGMVVGRYLGSLLLQKYDRFVILSVSAAIGALGFVVFWLGNSQVVSLIGLFLGGLGVANLYANLVTLSFDAAGAARATAGSATTLASGVAILSLPFALGSLADLLGIRIAMLLVAILYLALIAIMLSGRKAAAIKPV
ncbi:MAG: MFS transporter [Anaerolineaceae bacterium]|nr:MFS transporter [Anaerolineaceae bacterium]MDD4043203.1 MFS transporter [Anaerolineaceae bacterium]MDD4577858.1 MFS transporter [Anaerolineaceae bacterium]